jgi:hypothetical protein
MLLMTGSTRSGGVSQGRPEGDAPAVGAQRRALTDAAAQGTRPRMLRASYAPLFCGSPAYLRRSRVSSW